MKKNPQKKKNKEKGKCIKKNLFGQQKVLFFFFFLFYEYKCFIYVS